MHIDGFRYFIALSQAGSFNRAAEELFISQQGLNRAITSLENELGAKLVTRSRKGARLTPQGEAFLAHARVIVSEYDALTAEIGDSLLDEGEAASPLTLVTTSYLSQLGLAPIRGTQLAKRAQTREMLLNRLLERLEAGASDELYLVDLFPDTMAKLARSGALAFEPLFSSTLGVICHESFPLQPRGPVHRADLAKVPMAYNCDSAVDRFVSRMFADAPLTNVRLTSTNGTSLIEYVGTGEVMSLFDSYAYHVGMRSSEFRALHLRFTPLAHEEAVTRVGFLYRTDAPPSPRERRLIREAKRCFEAENADYLRDRRLTCVSPLG
ncbi:MULTISPECIES: LysR family transcriptional regulator [unclassified Adlercreutzia]|uniref:LysR family transcriptional regulator n=1 Tax=unclassified Adlercreutzia TaxID=2636013 RepID=UPI0013EBEE7C|nr:MULTISPECIES: LysR family transcriptional regulator [unclassified Adlercreutzia]